MQLLQGNRCRWAAYTHAGMSVQGGGARVRLYARLAGLLSCARRAVAALSYVVLGVQVGGGFPG